MTHSRIRIKYEPGDKARPFAIVDFFSQSALKSIHDYSMNWLKSLSTDGTAEHSRAAKAVLEWTKDPTLKLWSYDLTNATDRFPVFLQEIVIKQMFGDEIGGLWKDIIVNRDFVGPEGEMVRWSTGQPLGCLSSWSIFAITHHLLLQTAAYESGCKTWFMGYRIIGDDICIAGSESIATKYREYLNDLKAEISLLKSILPEHCSEGYVGEIAKRIFHKGVEVTPVPPLAIKEAMTTLTGYRNLLESSADRGYTALTSPYPVQSTLVTKLEFASLTFPIRNRLSIVRSVKTLFQVGREDDDAPAGLNPNWFIWCDTPDEIIIKAVRKFLFERVNKAVEKSTQILQRILLARYMKSEREDLPQGGDWKPGPFECHPDILTEAFTELQEVLLKNQQKLWSDNLLQGEVTDLYVFIGQLHKYLEPEILLSGRTDFNDEKKKTLVFISSMVKYVSNLHKSGDWSILDQEPEVNSFPLLDDLDFFLIE